MAVNDNDDIIKRLDRIEEVLWHGNGNDPLSVQVALIKEKAATIERLRVEVMVGHRAVVIASVSFALTVIGWLVLFIRDWIK